MDAEGVDGHRILGDQKGGIACEVEQSSADGLIIVFVYAKSP